MLFVKDDIITLWIDILSQWALKHLHRVETSKEKMAYLLYL